MHITKRSTTYLTRIDAYQINEETQELYVVDDFGMNVMYDCALDDLVNLDKELLKVGTYFIKKNENQFDFKQYSFPLIDRFETLEDLLIQEFEYQFQKAKLVMVYLEVFEHICDPLE